MGRLFIDGFEGGQFDLWTATGSPTISTTQKKTGAYAAYFENYNGNYYLTRSLGANYQTLYVKFHLYVTNTAPNAGTILTLLSPSGSNISLSMSNANRLVVYRGGTALATGATTISANAWHLIEAKFYIADSSGIAQVKLNGLSEIDYSGDTKNQSEAYATQVRIGAIDFNSWKGYIDDFVVDDASWIGDTRIVGIAPSGSGASAQWTPSTGSNYACVDEIPASDTDYVATNSVDQLDTYAVGDLGAAVDTVKCVQVQARCVKEGAPTPTNLKLATRISGTDYLSANKAVGTTAAALCNLWETSPATSAAWTLDEVNGCEIGFKSAA
jgi:hypothetical protein